MVLAAGAQLKWKRVMTNKGNTTRSATGARPAKRDLRKAKAEPEGGARKKKPASFEEVFGVALNERVNVVIKGQARSLTMKELIVEQLGEKAVAYGGGLRDALLMEANTEELTR
jgi:hypothetical protein